jgi:hypothetical protein
MGLIIWVLNKTCKAGPTCVNICKYIVNSTTKQNGICQSANNVATITWVDKPEGC